MGQRRLATQSARCLRQRHILYFDSSVIVWWPAVSARLLSLIRPTFWPPIRSDHVVISEVLVIKRSSSAMLIRLLIFSALVLFVHCVAGIFARDYAPIQSKKTTTSIQEIKENSCLWYWFIYVWFRSHAIKEDSYNKIKILNINM